MIVEKMFQLPGRIEFEGCSFEMRMFRSSTADVLAIGYFLFDVSESSRHYHAWSSGRKWDNPFDGFMNDTLLVRWVILSDRELLEAVEQCRVFLRVNKLL